jgi:hypothetical protein
VSFEDGHERLWGLNLPGVKEALLWGRMNPLLLLLVVLLLPAPPAAAEETGTITLVEQALRLIRGTTVLRAAEGVRLHPGDILESSSAGFVQLELAGGTVVALGPSSRLFVLGRGAKTTAELVLLSGWLKGETGPNAGAYCYVSPQFAATTQGGAVVLHASGDRAELFVESGTAGISKVSPDGNLASPEAGKAGQFFSRRGGRGVAISPHPDSAFVEAMPRPFRDTLPSRLSRFSKGVEAKRDHEVSYSEIQPWLTMGRAWRRGFVGRFQPRLKDAEFRKELEAHLNDHPEWRPVLHPEDEDAKTTPAKAENPAPDSRR